MSTGSNIERFDTVVLRSPLYTLGAYQRIPDNATEVSNFVKELFTDKLFAAAVFLASPALYYEWERSYSVVFADEKLDKLNKSILKYFIRASTNCVPFGLFASYSVIDKNRADLANDKKAPFTIITGIDTQVLMLLIGDLNAYDPVKSMLKYFKNNTTYLMGDTCRFVEADISGRAESRNYTLASVELDQVLELILSAAEDGTTIHELTALLVDSVEDLSNEQATAYIEELINAHILVSNLDLCLNGQAPLDQMISFLKPHMNMWAGDVYLERIFSLLTTLAEKLRGLTWDQITESGIATIEDIIQHIKALHADSDEKSALSINLKNEYPAGEMDGDDDKDQILTAIRVLSMFTTRNPHKHLTSYYNMDNFKRAFLARYGEGKEIPLLVALDSECGVGYIQNNKDIATFSDLLDGFPLPVASTQFTSIYSDRQADKFWMEVFLKAIRDNSFCVDLQQEDLSKFEDRKSLLAGTFPVMYSKSGDKIFIFSAGGASATHYIGRFTNGDNELASFANNIADAEQEIFSGNITAEVMHLPTNKAGNVSIRNINRPYELNIMGSHPNRGKMIEPGDIMISVSDDRIHLRSKQFNKEIIPFLSCAQNFHRDTLPYYHLMCDLQSQYRPNLLSLDYSSLIRDTFDFIPRIVYGNKLILAHATWNIKGKDLNDLRDEKGAFITEKLASFRQKNSIPRYVNLVENGNVTLLLDLDNDYLLSILSDKISREKINMITISECFYDLDRDKACYANEYIMSFTTAAKYPTGSLLDKCTSSSSVREKFIPGDEWLYYKIYTGINTADKLLVSGIKRIVDELLREELIDEWFFIRYNDPDFHLRVRFHLAGNAAKDHVINIVIEHIQYYIDNHYVWKIELATYERELNRYGEGNIPLSESLFYYDSKLSVELLQELKEDGREDHLWMYCLKRIDEYLNLFAFSVIDRLRFTENIFSAFSDEFNLDKDGKKSIADKFRQHSKALDGFLQKGDSKYDKLISAERKIRENIILEMLACIPKEEIENFVASHIHMHVNRLMKSRPRLHEMVLYGILVKIYRKEVGMNKYNVSLI
ncbi:lantibiotic dehydratase [Chitinophaga sp. 22321]|uniref:Lantibiotic dehydratase n=1 Tax=Chitinophaga hostae TaxID=2831022 RepID=A0ABS5IS05_9BACT|nr:lantibiotic dehydratase [Chitinophaga hostae]MBS0025729.1 lantibiotic dehydratase [Chitinophaga hostae]